MEFKIILGVLLALVLLTTLTAFICFMKVFYSPKRKPVGADEYPTTPGEIYEPYKERMIAWIKETRAMPHEAVELRSHDGLTLRGAYFEKEKGLPVELMFHGYQGSYERDLCCGVQRAFAAGRNAILIDQRASGTSDGSVCTFGIREYKDCLRWIDFAIKKFGEDCKIVLTGISMGGATVLTAAGQKLPPNVVCVLADCPFSSAKEMIEKTIKEMGLPAKLFYPLVKFGARLFGGFNLEETTPLQAMQTCETPVIFIHGDDDTLVPCEMSKRLYDACPTKKKLVFIKGAGHGLAYPKDGQTYVNALIDFQKECGF
jgi:dipeptidyl aminopeptidase/acylaminoacyl peptidase